MSDDTCPDCGACAGSGCENSYAPTCDACLCVACECDLDSEDDDD